MVPNGCYQRNQPLWHIAAANYKATARLGPMHASPHWQRAQQDPRMQRAEGLLEQERPPAAVSRKVALYATDDPKAIGALLGERTDARLYRVTVPSEALVSGRYDMAIVNTASLDQDAARAYWTGAPSSGQLHYWEVLATELDVVEEVPSSFVEGIRRRRLIALQQPRYDDLVSCRALNCDGQDFVLRPASLADAAALQQFARAIRGQWGGAKAHQEAGYSLDRLSMTNGSLRSKPTAHCDWLCIRDQDGEIVGLRTTDVDAAQSLCKLTRVLFQDKEHRPEELPLLATLKILDHLRESVGVDHCCYVHLRSAGGDHLHARLKSALGDRYLDLSGQGKCGQLWTSQKRPVERGRDTQIS